MLIQIIVLSAVFAMSAMPTQGFARKRSVASTKGKTIADVLKGIEKKADRIEFKKRKSNLPKYKKVKAVKKVNLGKIKPPRRSQLYFSEGTDEAELEKVTDEGIDQLYKLTRRFKTSSRRGELWLRLAELYGEKSRLIEYRIQKEYDEKIDLYHKGKSKRKPRLNLKRSQAYNKKAIQLYEWFLRDFPKDEKVPQALFFLGYNFFELGSVKKGERYYRRLTKEYPKSSYVEESNFALGEYYFENEDWKNALIHYKRVARNRRARLYSFSLYKVAWCDYKLGNTKKALKSLERVIYVGRKSKGVGDRTASGVSRIRLASEAVKDLVVFYADAGSYKNASTYFAKVAGAKGSFKLLDKLAYYYSDRGDHTAAHYTFTELIRIKPNSSKAYDYQYQIVQMYAGAGKNKKFRAELYNWLSDYGPESDWAIANAGNKELVAKSQELIEKTLRNYVLQQHQTAQNSRAAYAQQTAEKGYDLYFSSFKKGPKVIEMHFFYAELLFDMKKYAKAAKHYIWVAKNGKGTKYQSKAMLNSVLSLEKGLPNAKQVRALVDGSKEAVPFDDKTRLFEQASLAYFKKFPKGQDTTEIKYRLGSLYYYFNHFDKAVNYLKQVIKEKPKSKQAEYSANLILDIFNIKKDYDGLEKAAGELLAISSLAKSKVGAQIKGIKQRTAFKRAEKLEASKDFLGSAKAYRDFIKLNPTSPLIPAATFNAAVNFEKAFLLGSAINMYGMVIGRRGSSKDLKKKSQRFRALLFQQTGQYKRAAKEFESYAVANPKDPFATNFYFNAAVIYHGLRHYRSAMRNYQKYFDKSRKRDRLEVPFLMAQISEERGKLTLAMQYYEQYINGGTANALGVVEAAYKVYKISERLRKTTKAKKWYKKTIAIQRNLAKKGQSVGAGYAAEARFKLVYPTYQQLRRERIPANPAKQQRAVQKKLNLINRLKEELKLVVAYNDSEYIVAPLALQGMAFQHMASAIRKVPRPKSLRGDDLKAYQAGVDKLAKGFEDQALDNFKAAINKGFELKVRSEWLQTALTEANRLDKNLYVNRGFIVESVDKAVLMTKAPSSMSEGHGAEFKVSADDYQSLDGAVKSQEDARVIKAASSILEKDSKNIRALNALAFHHINKNEPGLAHLILERAIKVSDGEPTLKHNLGISYLRRKNSEAARAAFRSAVSADGDFAPSLAILGSEGLRYQDYSSSLVPLKDAYKDVKRDLSRGNLWATKVTSNYAICLVGAGKEKDAEDLYQDIMDAETRNVNVLLNYAILLVDVLKVKKEPTELLSRIKFISEDSKIIKKANELESRAGKAK